MTKGSQLDDMENEDERWTGGKLHHSGPITNGGQGYMKWSNEMSH